MLQGPVCIFTLVSYLRCHHHLHHRHMMMMMMICARAWQTHSKCFMPLRRLPGVPLIIISIILNIMFIIFTITLIIILYQG